jgi:hypothetical protein
VVHADDGQGFGFSYYTFINANLKHMDFKFNDKFFCKRLRHLTTSIGFYGTNSTVSCAFILFNRSRLAIPTWPCLGQKHYAFMTMGCFWSYAYSHCYLVLSRHSPLRNPMISMTSLLLTRTRLRPLSYNIPSEVTTPSSFSRSFIPSLPSVRSQEETLVAYFGLV